MKKQLLVLSLISLAAILPLPAVGIRAQTSCLGGTPYRDCPACGTARSRRGKQDNVLKNRDDSATNTKVLKVADLRDPLKNNSLYPNMEVEVTGYVVNVVQGDSGETSNCGRRDLTDIVIEIADGWEPGMEPRRHVILEITPRWQQKLGLDNEDYRAMVEKFRRETERKWVTFRGWMFFDSTYIDQSETTNPGNATNWRATPWEIHPVTYYEVLPGRPPR